MKKSRKFAEEREKVFVRSKRNFNSLTKKEKRELENDQTLREYCRGDLFQFIRLLQPIAIWRWDRVESTEKN